MLCSIFALIFNSLHCQPQHVGLSDTSIAMRQQLLHSSAPGLHNTQHTPMTMTKIQPCHQIQIFELKHLVPTPNEIFSWGNHSLIVFIKGVNLHVLDKIVEASQLNVKSDFMDVEAVCHTLLQCINCIPSKWLESQFKSVSCVHVQNLERW